MDALPPGAGDRDADTERVGSKKLSTVVSASSRTSGPRHAPRWPLEARETTVVCDFWRPGVMRPSPATGKFAPAGARSGPPRTRATTDRFAWPVGAGAHQRHCPSHSAGLRLHAPSIEHSSWRFVHEPVDTQSGRARNGGRARAGARCHREGTLALSRTCSVCRYCAHAAVEWRRSAAPDPFSPLDPQRHWGGRPLPMFAAAVPLPWKRVAEQLVNRTQEVPASAKTRVLASLLPFGPSSPAGLYLV